MGERDGIRVMIAGGGTGGHVYPGMAIYESLVDCAGPVEVMFVGVRGGMEEMILSSRRLPYTLIAGRGLRGAGVATKLMSPLALARSVWQAAALIRTFKPDVVIGTGGFASASAVIAALMVRLPVVLQEQNSVPGLVNRRLARFAKLVLLSYEESRRYLPGRAATSVIGNPLRAMPAATRVQAGEYFGLDPARKTVLVIGGSRGAHSLNLAGAGAAAILTTTHEVQFILLTGDHDHERVRTSLGDIADRVKVLRYLEDVHLAYALCDVAVARAGASSVFEVAVWGIPTIFVPYPYAADDHQAKNVAPLVARGAARVLNDGDANGKRVAEEIGALLDDDEARARMSVALKSWSRPDAARAAAALVTDLVKKKTGNEGQRGWPRPPWADLIRRSQQQGVRR